MKIRKRSMSVMLLVLFLFASLSVAVNAAERASGNLDIKLETHNYNSDPFFPSGASTVYVHLIPREKNGQYYFIPVTYNAKTKVSTGRLEKPVTGTYDINYYIARNGKESRARSAAKSVGKTPDSSLFLNLATEKNNLFSSSNFKKSITINKNGAALKLSMHILYDTFIPAVYAGIDNAEKLPYTLDFTIYESDKNGNTGLKIGTLNAKERRAPYFIDFAYAIPGTYYYVVKETTKTSYITTDKPFYVKADTKYYGNHLLVTQADLTQNGKTRRINIDLGKNFALNISIKDPDSKNAKYYIYDPFRKPFPEENQKTGTYSGNLTELSKKGNVYSTSVVTPADSTYWCSYMIIKKVNGVIDRGYTVNIPFMRSGDGTNVIWRLRPRMKFNAKAAASDLKTPVIKSAKAQSGSITVNWNTVPSGKGYYIEISPSQYFDKDVKSKFVQKITKSSKTLSGFSSGKKYYVRMRSYKMNGKTRIFSGWSKVVSTK